MFNSTFCLISGRPLKGSDEGPGFVYMHTIPVKVNLEHTSSSFSVVRLGVSSQTSREDDIKELLSSFKKFTTRWNKAVGRDELFLKLPSKELLGGDKFHWNQFLEKVSRDVAFPPAKKIFPHFVFAYYTENKRLTDQSVLLNFLPRLPVPHLQSVVGYCDVGEQECALVDDAIIEQLRHNFANHKLTNCTTALRVFGGRPVIVQLKLGDREEPTVPVCLPSVQLQDFGAAKPITSRTIKGLDEDFGELKLKTS